MEIRIEQIAIHVPNVKEAVAEYEKLGIEHWQFDEVKADGYVNGKRANNHALLAFNYDFIPEKEFELIQYVSGSNWLSGKNSYQMSHMGMHVTGTEMYEINMDMKRLGCQIVQDVYTYSHTNIKIKDTRRYHYLIFDSRGILGFDLKLIERMIL